MNYPQRPFEIEIEPTRGCNRACDFCGNYSLPKVLAMMTQQTAETAARKLSVYDGSRVIFCGRGEPMLNPNLSDLIMEFRGYLPSSQISVMTNGDRLTRNSLLMLYRSGVNYVVIDAYGGAKTEAKWVEFCRLNHFSYTTDSGRVWRSEGNKSQLIVLLSDIREGEKRAREITWRCGAVSPSVWTKYGLSPVLRPLQRRCSRPFRELEILWDGTIPLCCYDWVVRLPMANIHQLGNIREYWERGEKLNNIRCSLQEKNRAFVPCDKCDYSGGVRVGLLKTPV